MRVGVVARARGCARVGAEWWPPTATNTHLPPRTFTPEQFESYAKEAGEDAKRGRETEVKAIKARMEDEFAAAVERERRAAEDRAIAEATARFRQATQQLFDRVGEETDARIDVRNCYGGRPRCDDATALW